MNDQLQAVLERSKKVSDSLSKLSEKEMDQFKKAALAQDHGGGYLPKSLRDIAARLELAYTSGRLRQDVLEVLRLAVVLNY